jgi:hypothetical protein
MFGVVSITTSKHKQISGLYFDMHVAQESIISLANKVYAAVLNK